MNMKNSRVSSQKSVHSPYSASEEFDEDDLDYPQSPPVFSVGKNSYINSKSQNHSQTKPSQSKSHKQIMKEEEEEIEEDSMDENDLDSMYSSPVKKGPPSVASNYSKSNRKLFTEDDEDEIDEDLYAKADLFSQNSEGEEEDSLGEPRLPEGCDDLDKAEEDPLNDSLEEVFSIKEKKWLKVSKVEKKPSLSAPRISEASASASSKSIKPTSISSSGTHGSRASSSIPSASVSASPPISTAASSSSHTVRDSDDEDSLIDLATLRARRREEDKEKKKKAEEEKRIENARKLAEERRIAFEEAKKAEMIRKETEKKLRIEEEKRAKEAQEAEARRLKEQERLARLQAEQENQRKRELAIENEKNRAREREAAAEAEKLRAQERLAKDHDTESVKSRVRSGIPQLSKKPQPSKNVLSRGSVPSSGVSNIPRGGIRHAPAPSQAPPRGRVSEDEYEGETFHEEEDIPDDDSLEGHSVSDYGRSRPPSSAPPSTFAGSGSGSAASAPANPRTKPLTKMEQIKKLYEENVAVDFQNASPTGATHGAGQAPAPRQSHVPLPSSSSGHACSHPVLENQWDDDISVLTNDEFSYAPSHRKPKKVAQHPTTVFEEEEDLLREELEELDTYTSSKKSKNSKNIKQIPLGKISKKIMDNIYVPKEEKPSNTPPSLPNFPFLAAEKAKPEEKSRRAVPPPLSSEPPASQRPLGQKKKAPAPALSQSSEFERKILEEIQALDSRKEEIMLGARFKSPSHQREEPISRSPSAGSVSAAHHGSGAGRATPPAPKRSTPSGMNRQPSDNINSKPKRVPAFLQPTASSIKAKAEAQSKIQQLKEKDTKEKRAFGPGFKESKPTKEPTAKPNQSQATRQSSASNDRKSHDPHSPSRQTPAEIISDWKKNVQNEKIQYSKRILSDLEAGDLASVVSGASGQSRRSSNTARHALELARDAVSGNGGYLSEFQKKVAVSKVQDPPVKQLRLRGGTRDPSLYEDDSVYSRQSKRGVKLPNIAGAQNRRNSDVLLYPSTPVCSAASRQSSRSAPSY